MFDTSSASKGVKFALLEGQLLAGEQGLPMRRGLLGVEWDGPVLGNNL